MGGQRQFICTILSQNKTRAEENSTILPSHPSDVGAFYCDEICLDYYPIISRRACARYSDVAVLNS